MLNLEAIRKAIAILSSKDGRELSKKRITISTSGIIKGIYDLADNGPKIRLAVSLTTADEELRKRLMPCTNTNPLSELKKAVKYYAEKTGKRVTLEAALLSGENTKKESAQKMIESHLCYRYSGCSDCSQCNEDYSYRWLRHHRL